MNETPLSNPYGLAALWAQGDWVAKGTLLILVLRSMASWYVIFTKLAEQRRVLAYAKKAQSTFWNAGSSKSSAFKSSVWASVKSVCVASNKTFRAVALA